MQVEAQHEACHKYPLPFASSGIIVLVTLLAICGLVKGLVTASEPV